MSNKPKLAYFSPLEPTRSGISDYSRDLLEEMCKYFDITVIVKDALPPKDFLGNLVKIVSFAEIKNIKFFLSEFDEILYHMGNHIYHDYIYETAILYPGIVVMHDYALHHMIAAKTLVNGDIDIYKTALAECGIELKNDIHCIKDVNFMWENYPLDFPLNEKIIVLSKGIIVHSQFCADLIKRQKNHPYIFVIPMYAKKFKEYVQMDKISIGCFGFLSRNKRIDVLISVFADIIKEFKDIPMKLLLVGGYESNDFKGELERLITSYKLEDKIEIKGYMNESEYLNLLDETTICVNLRYPTVGETSLSLMQIMAHSKPCIVTNVGWYGELPEDSVIKISYENEKRDLKESLLVLISNNDLRRKIGQNAYSYAHNNCNLQKVVELYMDCMNKIKCYELLKNNCINGISNSIDEIGVEYQNNILVLQSISKDLTNVLF